MEILLLLAAQGLVRIHGVRVCSKRWSYQLQPGAVSALSRLVSLDSLVSLQRGRLQVPQMYHFAWPALDCAPRQ